MKNITVLILSMILWVQFAMCQIENAKSLIKQNKVKFQLEKLCHSSCSTKSKTFDRNGNMVEFNFYRIGTLNKYEYDANNNLKYLLWVDKFDNTKIDTILPANMKRYTNFEDNCKEKILSNGKLIVKEWQNEKREIHLDNFYRIQREIKFVDNEIVLEKEWNYDSSSRVILKKTKNKKRIARINKFKESDGEQQIDFIEERTVYNSKGQISEFYTYFSDPCLGLDNHYLYRYQYLDNGLIEGAEVYENEKNWAFSLEYNYEYFK